MQRCAEPQVDRAGQGSQSVGRDRFLAGPSWAMARQEPAGQLGAGNLYMTQHNLSLCCMLIFDCNAARRSWGGP
jgi:hypothetical protein